jgi:hypothetical protein
LLLRYNSWPVSRFGTFNSFFYKDFLSVTWFLVPAQDIILSKIDKIARFIIETPATSFIGTDLLQTIMKSLQDLKEQQKRLLSGNSSISDVITKMMFVLAPLTRFAASMVMRPFSLYLFTARAEKYF